MTEEVPMSPDPKPNMLVVRNIGLMLALKQR